MKRILLFCSLFLLGMACSQEEVVPPKDSNAEEIAQKIDEYQTPGDHVVTAAEALSRAETILSRWETRSTPRVVKSCEYFVAKPATRSLADTIEVAFHLINYEDNGGFAMVAADERATDIYAYSDEGQLTAADFEQNPGLSIYKEIATETYQAEVMGIIGNFDDPGGDGPVGPVTPTPNDGPNGIIVQLPDGTWCIRQLTFDRSHTCGPLLNTMWHQRPPYNYLCGGDLAGCAAIAIGQIFAFHGYPASHNGYVYNWNNMEQNFEETEELGLYDVASLILQIRQEAGTNGTSTPYMNVVEAIRAFGYHSTHRETLKRDAMKNNLASWYPVLMMGNKSMGIFSEGHFWVVDGYILDDYDFVYYERYPPYNVIQRGNFYSIMFHINWGWGPNSVSQTTNNGYYFLTDDFTYTHHVDAVYEIYPNH